MIARAGSLLVDTMASLRWLLPVLLVIVAAALLCLDGHLLVRGVRPSERSSLGVWIADNFWIVVGCLLALYVVAHYPSIAPIRIRAPATGACVSASYTIP